MDRRLSAYCLKRRWLGLPAFFLILLLCGLAGDLSGGVVIVIVAMALVLGHLPSLESLPLRGLYVLPISRQAIMI